MIPPRDGVRQASLYGMLYCEDFSLRGEVLWMREWEGNICTYAGVEGVYDLRSEDLAHKSGKSMMSRSSALTMYIA